LFSTLSIKNLNPSDFFAKETSVKAVLWEKSAYYREVLTLKMGRFFNMERCIVSYQEVLRFVFKNVNH
jgi:hypothetical protein